MNRIIIFVIGTVCGTVVTTAVHNSHLVRTDENFLIVPRAGVVLKDVYADVREWTAEDWRAHPELTRDMQKAGHVEIIRAQTTEREMDGLLESNPSRVSERAHRQQDWE